MTELTSRERMLRALNLEGPDHVPCCFMSFTALRRRHRDNMYELSKAERAMGLDSMLFIPVAPRPQRPEHPDLRGLPVGFAPEVEIKEWREEVEGGFGILHKEYSTPGGKLATSVRLSADWPHGGHIPFVDDYQVPRSLKPLITGPEELEALQYLLTPPREEDVAQFEREAEKAHAFGEQHGVLLALSFHPSTTSPSTPRAPGATLRFSRTSGTGIGDTRAGGVTLAIYGKRGRMSHLMLASWGQGERCRM